MNTNLNTNLNINLNTNSATNLEVLEELSIPVKVKAMPNASCESAHGTSVASIDSGWRSRANSKPVVVTRSKREH